MNKSLLIILSLLASLSFNCGALYSNKETKNDTGILALLAASNSNTTSNPNCATKALDAITSIFTHVTNPSRMQYNISGCGLSEFSAINFTANELTTGATGTGSTSTILSNGNISIDQARGGTNVEVTFKLNGASGSLDVIAYGTSAGSDNSGPTYRLLAGSVPQYKSLADGTFKNFMARMTSTATTSTLAADITYTYCLDFQYTTTSKNYMNGWEKPCAEVTSTERGSMSYYPIMKMSDVPVFTSGSKIGFVLNNATVTSFTVGTIIVTTQ